MIGIVILAILIILLVNSDYSPLLRIRNKRYITDTTDGSTGIVTKGSYNIPYVRIRTEIQDMLGV
jgi:hypothetical protein